MDGAMDTHRAQVRAAAVAYCEGIHTSDVAVFESLCHERFVMTSVAGSGKAVFWDKAAYLERVGGRAPFDGAPDYEILTSLRDDCALQAVFGQLVERELLEPSEEESFYQFVIELQKRNLLSLPVTDGDSLFQQFEI